MSKVQFKKKRKRKEKKKKERRTMGREFLQSKTLGKSQQNKRQALTKPA